MNVLTSTRKSDTTEKLSYLWKIDKATKYFPTFKLAEVCLWIINKLKNFFSFITYIKLFQVHGILSGTNNGQLKYLQQYLDGESRHEEKKDERCENLETSDKWGWNWRLRMNRMHKKGKDTQDHDAFVWNECNDINYYIFYGLKQRFICDGIFFLPARQSRSWEFESKWGPQGHVEQDHR